MKTHLVERMIWLWAAVMLSAAANAESAVFEPFHADIAYGQGPARNPLAIDRALLQITGSNTRAEILSQIEKNFSAPEENKIRYDHGHSVTAAENDGENAVSMTRVNKFSNSAAPPVCAPSPLTPGRIVELVKAAAARHGVDPEFALAIAWAESRFDQVRNSPAGARGPMQLMPDTAARFGVADICDPASNIDGGIRYLRALIERFKNPLVVAAAYNAGEQSIYDNNGIPPYTETVRYVARVINRQLGLDTTVKRPGRNIDRLTIPTNPSSMTSDLESGVIGARSATFVGGVMKF